MKFVTRKTLLIAATIACLSGLFFLSPLGLIIKNNVFAGAEKWEEEGEEGEKEREAGVGKQMETFWQARAFPDPTYINDKFWAAFQHYQAMKTPDRPSHFTRTDGTDGTQRLNAGGWSCVGPTTDCGGRILSLAINPASTNTVFAGSASGGIWKTTNGGGSWSSVATGLPALSIPTMIISTANPNVMYAGTGEVYRVDTSNVGFNVWKARGSYGIGIIKSTDGGLTWTQAFVQSTSNLFGIQKLRFAPSSDNTIYACATDGLYRSTDAGVTWSNIAVGKIFVTDVAVNSADPNQILITVGNLTNATKGVFRTTNGASATPTWTKITSGLAASFKGMGRLAYASGNTVYAGLSNGSGNELYRSTNFGTSWTALTNTSYNSYQYWFCNALVINPAKPDTLILGGVDLYRYRAGTQARTTITGIVHSDMHDVAFDPSNNNTFYVACDGGVYKTTNGGGSFNDANNGLTATQFYASFGVSTTTANRFVGGLQDNGVWQYNSGAWTKRLGGDGGPSAFVEGTNTVFASLDAREVYRSNDGGGSFSRVTTGTVWRSVADSRTGFMAPIALSKSTPNTIYIGSDNLHKSTTGGGAGSWSNDNFSSATNYIQAQHKTAVALAVSPTNANKVYVSTSAFAQFDNDVDNLHVSPPPDILRTTTGNTPFTSIKGTLPNRFVMDFAISPGNDDSVMIVLGGYGGSHVYLTGNGGTTWIDRGTGLPDVPFNAIIFDKTNSNVVYAGCDLGIYVSNNRGLTWFDFNGGFADPLMVFDLQMTSDNKIVAATHGRGIWISNLADANSLPVNILEFTGTNQGAYNQLKWKANERDMLHYELERKIDNGAFYKVANITALNSTTVASYSYNDPLPAAGNNFYYRLKSVNTDGTFTYSSVVLIKIRRPGKLDILGNPVTASSVIQLSLADPQKVIFKIYDTKGRVLHVQNINAVAGVNRYPFSMFGVLPSGHYVLEAIAGQDRFSKRIIITR
jgi:hypothetical protein